MMKHLRPLVRIVALFGVASTLAGATGPVSWERRLLTDKYYCDGINCRDFNRDGKLDIVAGPFWYGGPDFKTTHEIYPPKEFPTYAVADSPLGPYTRKGLISQQNTWNSPISAFFHLAESDQLIAICEQWLTGPDGKRVPAELSCQLWLPVTFDPATGVAQMQHVQLWDPWVPTSRQ